MLKRKADGVGPAGGSKLRRAMSLTPASTSAVAVAAAATAQQSTTGSAGPLSALAPSGPGETVAPQPAADSKFDEFGDIPDDLLIGDVAVALSHLRKQFPQLVALRPRRSATVPAANGQKGSAGVIFRIAPFPVAFVSQIRSYVPDATLLTKQLVALQNKGVVRTFHLSGRLDDAAVAFTSDYNAWIRRTAAQPSYSAQERTMLERFADSVQNLKGSAFSATAFSDMFGAENVEAASTLLLAVGLIVRAATRADGISYSLSLPQSSSLVSAMEAGSKEVVQLLERTRYKELSLTNFASKKLKSPLPLEFHLRDLVGRGTVSLLQATTGPMYRLNKSATE